MPAVSLSVSSLVPVTMGCNMARRLSDRSHLALGWGRRQRGETGGKLGFPKGQPRGCVTGGRAGGRKRCPPTQRAPAPSLPHVEQTPTDSSPGKELDAAPGEVRVAQTSRYEPTAFQEKRKEKVGIVESGW